jgi:hypothetical protein
MSDLENLENLDGIEEELKEEIRKLVSDILLSKEFLDALWKFLNKEISEEEFKKLAGEAVDIYAEKKLKELERERELLGEGKENQENKENS